jgi:glycerol-3-phosphate dehydrogenase
VSRDYRIVEDTLSGGQMVLSLIGGKWTTFRALGEHLANEALRLLGHPRTVSTIGLAIGGGSNFPTTPAQRAAWVTKHQGALAGSRVEELLTRYGTVAIGIMEDISLYGDAPLVHTPRYSVGEITALAQREHVVTLGDMIFRRTLLGFTGDISAESVKEIASIIGPILGWTKDELAKQVSAIPLERSHTHEP